MVKKIRVLVEGQTEEIFVRDVLQPYFEPQNILLLAQPARLKEIMSYYGKVLHGPIIAKRIGLAAIRKRCPHFDEWVKQLENI